MDDTHGADNPRHDTAVLVPLSPIARSIIAAGSGIAGRFRPDGGLSVSFEGNLYGAVNIVTFADRVCQAVDRLVSGYPTIARMHGERDEFLQIGRWDDDRGEVRLDGPEAARALADWLGLPEVPLEELRASGRYAERRFIRDAIASGDPAQMAVATEFARLIGVAI